MNPHDVDAKIRALEGAPPDGQTAREALALCHELNPILDALERRQQYPEADALIERLDRLYAVLDNAGPWR